MNIQYVTLTGVDETSDLDELDRIACLYPLVEWAVLYSPTKVAQPRYPSQDFIFRFMARRKTPNCQLSIHLCGQAVRQAFENDEVVESMLVEMNSRHGRIQLNFRQEPRSTKQTIQSVIELTRQYPNIRFIIQDNGFNTEVIAGVLEETALDVLCDNSGGKGIKQALWPAVPVFPKSLYSDFTYGYAGGLGPHNILHELKSIASMVGPRHPTWIDMESSLRSLVVNEDTTIDCFSTTKCIDVLNQVYAFKGAYA